MFGWNFSTVNQDETYNLHDAIITALILNWLVGNCDTVKMAMYSTFVNITGALHVTKEAVSRERLTMCSRCWLTIPAPSWSAPM